MEPNEATQQGVVRLKISKTSRGHSWEFSITAEDPAEVLEQARTFKSQVTALINEWELEDASNQD